MDLRFVVTWAAAYALLWMIALTLWPQLLGAQ